MRDDRWANGMDGWRVRIVGRDSHGRYGEVTGYSHSGNYLFVVLDGCNDALRFKWSEVRPA